MRVINPIKLKYFRKEVKTYIEAFLLAYDNWKTYRTYRDRVLVKIYLELLEMLMRENGFNVFLEKYYYKNPEPHIYVFSEDKKVLKELKEALNIRGKIKETILPTLPDRFVYFIKLI